MKKFIKKWWLEQELPDGRFWTGWFGTTALHKEDFPPILKGEVWSEGRPDGQYGCFILDGQENPENQPVFGTMYPSYSSDVPLEEWEPISFRIEDAIVPEYTYIDSYEVPDVKKRKQQDYER